MACAPTEIQSLKQARGWTDKTEDDFIWSYWPTLGHHQGTGTGSAPGRASPACRQLMLGSQHPLQARCPCILAKHPAQHCLLPFKQLFSNLQWACQSSPIQKSLPKNLPMPYLIAYAIVLPLSHMVHTFFYINNDLLFLQYKAAIIGQWK